MMLSGARNTLLALVTAVAVVAAVTLTGTAAIADTSPDAGVPATVAADSLPVPQINGVVWAQVIVGNTVYVGGEFTKARPFGSAPGVNEVSRNNLLAYNLTTGELTGFNPNLNSTVRALVAAKDGSRVYVGGNFTKAGTVTRYRLAAFTVSSGALVTSWAPQLNGRVAALGISGGSVFAGGTFTQASGQARTYMASFAIANGAVQPWQGKPAGGTVTALTVSPDNKKVIIGGSFTSYNGRSNPGYGMAATSSYSGASLTWKVNGLIRNGGTVGSITSLTSTSSGVFGTGYVWKGKPRTGDGNLEGAFRASWADGTLVWLEDCHGDTYSAAATASVVYTTGHPHDCKTIGGPPETEPRSFHRTLAFTMNATGTILKNLNSNYYNFEGKPRPSLLTFYPEINTGSYTGQGQGPWHVTANSQYVLYGGEFTIVNNKAQQGLARFAVSSIAPNKQGPRANGPGFVPKLASPAAGSVKVTWASNYDRDNELLTYSVLRGGATVKTLTGRSTDWKRPTLTWTETGLPAGTYAYRIRVADPRGNVVTGDAVSITVSGAAANRMAAPSDSPEPSPSAGPTFDATAEGLTVAVDATRVTSPGKAIRSYAWTWGDGSTGTGATMTHAYAKAGTYEVKLTTTDASGAEQTQTRSVEVDTPPVPTPPVPTPPVPTPTVPTPTVPDAPETPAPPAGEPAPAPVPQEPAPKPVEEEPVAEVPAPAPDTEAPAPAPEKETPAPAPEKEAAAPAVPKPAPQPPSPTPAEKKPETPRAGQPDPDPRSAPSPSTDQPAAAASRSGD
jgi:PKD repeat protein